MNSTAAADVFGLLRGIVHAEGSDLHLVSGYPPTYRIHGRLRAVGESLLDAEMTRTMIEAVLPEPARTQALDSKHLDCSFSIDHDGKPLRFRANVFRARGCLGACFRYVPEEIPSFEWMGFPAPLADRIVNLHNGLVVITGVTGSGKTTTLAGLIQKINRAGGQRVITVEHPIEYVYAPTEGSLITQREVGVDVDSFCDGLVSGLRQDPDVILVGEIRDRETAQMAISAAETGHLILTTLHTQDAKGAITRLIDLFPYDAQEEVRSQLSLSLRYVVCQHLLPGAEGQQKRALALEVLNVTQPVQAVIRAGRIAQIESAIQTGRKDGMFALDESLAQLASVKRISWKTAERFAKDASALRDYLP